MVLITAKVVGGSAKSVQASTVADAFEQLGLSGQHTAQINGQSANLSDSVQEGDFVTFTRSVKGGR